MEMKKVSSLKLIGLIGISALALAAFSQRLQQSSIARLQKEPLDLQVDVIQQSRSTSCGEAVIVMAYNYAHPQTPIYESEVIEYAAAQGYFTEDITPFTSPNNMVKIAQHYSKKISTGRVLDSIQGLSLLIQRLRAGEPVVIDVLSDFSDPGSEAHFILVTGISTDPSRENALVIHYNDPLTGTKESDDWSGSEGVWNVWQHNKDPGGSGWWMVMSLQ